MPQKFEKWPFWLRWLITCLLVILFLVFITLAILGTMWLVGSLLTYAMPFLTSVPAYVWGATALVFFCAWVSYDIVKEW